MKTKTGTSMLYRLFRGRRLLFKKAFNSSVSLYLKSCGKNLNLLSDAFIDGGEYISVGNGFSALNGLRIEAIGHYAFTGDTYTPEIIIGDDVSLGRDCHIGAINKVKIGDNVLIGSKVCIIDHQHGELSAEDLKIPPKNRRLVSNGPVIIGRNVWIGDNVVIMPNVEIGDNTVIGANAVVTESIPANCVAAGVPAVVIKQIG